MGARLFTAVLPPDDVVEELDAFLAPRRDAEPRLRWTRPDSWHLTASFMADVGDRHVDRLCEALAQAASRTPAFPLGLRGGGAFGWAREARTLWLGADPGGEELSFLASRCRNAATVAGVRADGGRFVPHLTLGRSNRPLDATRLLRVLDTFGSRTWVADEVVLVASHLADRTQRYEVVQRFALPQGETAHGDGSGSR